MCPIAHNCHLIFQQLPHISPALRPHVNITLHGEKCASLDLQLHTHSWKLGKKKSTRYFQVAHAYGITDRELAPLGKSNLTSLTVLSSSAHAQCVAHRACATGEICRLPVSVQLKPHKFDKGEKSMLYNFLLHVFESTRKSGGKVTAAPFPYIILQS